MCRIQISGNKVQTLRFIGIRGETITICEGMTDNSTPLIEKTYIIR